MIDLMITFVDINVTYFVKLSLINYVIDISKASQWSTSKLLAPVAQRWAFV